MSIKVFLTLSTQNFWNTIVKLFFETFRIFAKKYIKVMRVFLLLGCDCEVLANLVAIAMMLVCSLFSFSPLFSLKNKPQKIMSSM
jgi:hypothetical protein